MTWNEKREDLLQFAEKHAHKDAYPLAVKDYLRIWDDSALFTVPFANLPFRICDASLQFLRKVGLPETAVTLMHFDTLTLGLPTLMEFVQGKCELPKALKLHHEILTKYGSPEWSQELRFLGYTPSFYFICLDTKMNNAVTALFSAHEKDYLFVNSDVLRLAEFLKIWQHYVRLGETHSNAEIFAMREEIRSKLLKVDPAAVKDEHCYWFHVIEEEGC